MKTCKHKTGVTLVEMLIVVAILALLVTMIISAAGRIQTRAEEQLAESTIAIITAALGQFRDYEYRYQPPYTDFDFPLDCNDYIFSGHPLNLDLKTTLVNSLGAANVSIAGGIPNPVYSASEMLYFFLSQVTECRKTMDKIDSSLIVTDGLMITIDGKDYPLLRIIDPWGISLRYDYYDEWEPNLILRESGKRTFPVITSAGPDRTYGTADDITSR